MEKTHLGRAITFDHCRFIPVNDGFKIYYISEDNMLGSILDEITIPPFAIDSWVKYLSMINNKIPTEKEVESYLHNTFLKKDD